MTIALIDSGGLAAQKAFAITLSVRYVSRMSAITETPGTELGSMIVRTPGVIGGKPHVKGHRVGVHRVAGWWKSGLSVEEIGERLSTLSPAEIHVALAYYHLHREEIDGYLDEERAACASLERKPSAPT